MREAGRNQRFVRGRVLDRRARLTIHDRAGSTHPEDGAAPRTVNSAHQQIRIVWPQAPQIT
jgi:hypothetical protein